MNILADSNILYAKEAFSAFGMVTLIDGRSITRERLETMDVLLVRSITPVTRQLLENTQVKFVASATIGTDHVDLDFLRDSNIGFAHAPGSNANSVAEYIVSALVHLAQKKQRDFSGMTLGIIGAGNVGSRVYAMAQALGMRTLLNDPPKKAMTQSDIYIPLSNLLAESDIVTVHVPLTAAGADATFHLANDAFFGAMKRGAFFLNTSRGDVVDETSLRHVRQRLSGVALDVWSGEPRPHAATIAACDVATPHIAGYSYDGKVAGTDMIHSAMAAYFFADAEKAWMPPEAQAEQKKIVLDAPGAPGAPDVTKSQDVIFAAVKAAYPIMEDDARFRKILDKDADKQAAFFDELRREYPKRLEFRNYLVSVPKKCPPAIVTELSSLGFKVSASL
jgi:erythronate-4-phosphate dehydrogenase